MKYKLVDFTEAPLTPKNQKKKKKTLMNSIKN